MEERAKIGAVEDNPHAREAWVGGGKLTDSKSKDWSCSCIVVLVTIV